MNESILWSANIQGGPHKGKTVEVTRRKSLVNLSRQSDNKATAYIIHEDGKREKMGQICIGGEGEKTPQVINDAVLTMLNSRRNKHS